MAAVLLVPVLVLVAVAVWLVVNASGGTVPRRRLERFARREALPITVGNGNLVIRYLAVTRRWRTLGLVTGVVLVLAWAAREGTVRIDFLAAFAGWFVGAVVAELRVATAEPGGPRVASLRPRLLRDRLRPPARLLPVLMVVGVAGVAGYLLLTDLGGRPVDSSRTVTLLALGLATFAVPVAAGRYVLQRPQPLSMPGDVRAADDARRDRSLHVLAGSAIGLLGYPLAQLLSLLDDEVAGSVGVGLLLLGLLAGWWVATTSRSAWQLRDLGRPGEVVPRP